MLCFLFLFNQVSTYVRSHEVGECIHSLIKFKDQRSSDSRCFGVSFREVVFGIYNIVNGEGVEL